MNIELWKIFVSLGVPGLALGVFFMLFRSFNWKFPAVPKNWVGPIIVIFMLLVGSVTLYALALWAPNNNQATPIATETQQDSTKYDEQFALDIANSLPNCQYHGDSNRVIELNLVYSFANAFYKKDWVYESFSLNVQLPNVTYPITPEEESIGSGLYHARFCLEVENEEQSSVRINLASRSISKSLTSLVWEKIEDKYYGTVDPVVLLRQPDPDWVILKRADWLTNSDGAKRLSISLFNPLDIKHPGAIVRMTLGDSFLHCASLGSDQIMKVRIRKGSKLELQTEDLSLGELIERTAKIHLGPCGEHDLELDFGEISSLLPKELNRIIYTFEVSDAPGQMEPEYLEKFKFGSVGISGGNFYPSRVRINNFDSISSNPYGY